MLIQSGTVSTLFIRNACCSLGALAVGRCQQLPVTTTTSEYSMHDAAYAFLPPRPPARPAPPPGPPLPPVENKLSNVQCSVCTDLINVEPDCNSVPSARMNREIRVQGSGTQSREFRLCNFCGQMAKN